MHGGCLYERGSDYRGRFAPAPFHNIVAHPVMVRMAKADKKVQQLLTRPCRSDAEPPTTTEDDAWGRAGAAYRVFVFGIAGDRLSVSHKLQPFSLSSVARSA